MMSNKATVQIFRDPTSAVPEETFEFAFLSAAREWAREQVAQGKARRAVVKDPAGATIATFPA